MTVLLLTVNQPLFVISKKIQWTWPETYGEDKFLVTMVLLIVLGDWIDGSGWISVMTVASITTNGKGGALKKESFTARSLLVHQVIAVAFFCLRNQAYHSYKLEVEAKENPGMSFNDWCALMANQHPQL